MCRSFVWLLLPIWGIVSWSAASATDEVPRTTPVTILSRTAFPGAEGFGRFARGGRGGDVYHVINPHDDGPGSLREGIRSATGPRTIVFDVSGTIELNSPLTIDKSFLTIAGQSAPGDGVCLKDQIFRLRQVSHVIVRYLRVRLGDKNKPAGSGRDAKQEVKTVTTFDPDVPVDQLQVMVKPLTRSELEAEADAWFELWRNKARQVAAASLGAKKTNEAVDTGNDRATEKSLSVVAAVRGSVDAAAEETEKGLTETAQQTLGVDDTRSEGATAGDDAMDEESPSADGSAEADNVSAGESGDGAVVEEAEKMKVALLADVTTLQDERTALSDRLEIVLDALEEKGGEVEEYWQYVAAVSGVELDTSDARTTWAGIMGWITSKEGGQRWAWNLAKFVLILIGTSFVAKIIASIVSWLLERRLTLSQLAERLIANTITNLIMLLGFAIALTALEIDITPIVAAIAATGLVVGLALQGTLSNFASGLMILINRPFDVGDVVTAGGVTGKVHQMNLVSTTFRTFDNQTIHVPNNEIWNNVITNITTNDTRRVDLEFGIGYDDDFEQAEQIIQDVVSGHKLTLSDPEPVVVTRALADSSVNIVNRPWADTGDWWQVKTDVTREVKRRFDEAGITIPYSLSATGYSRLQ